MPVKTPGNVVSTLLNVIRRIHIGRIERGDHRVKARLLLGRQRFVGRRNERIGEGVARSGRGIDPTKRQRPRLAAGAS